MELRDFLSAFGLGAFFGAAIVLMVVVSGEGSQAQVSFDQLNVSYREIAVDTANGDRLECGVSRFNEVQISDSAYIYRNSTCESWMLMNGSTVTAPVKGEVLFDGKELRIGFDFDEEYVVCDVSKGNMEIAGEGSYVYNGADCIGYSGSLYNQWNDPEFENFNVHEWGRELLENQTAQ